jgi:hypothetical protein
VEFRHNSDRIQTEFRWNRDGITDRIQTELRWNQDVIEVILEKIEKQWGEKFRIILGVFNSGLILI